MPAKQSSKWITHVKAYSKANNCSYGDAMSRAKSSSPQFSNEVYTVGYRNGNNIKLSDGKVYKRYSILKVVSDAKQLINPKQKLIKNARSTHTALKLLSQEENNFPTQRQKRSSKPPDRLKF